MKVFALLWKTTDDSGCEAVFTDLDTAEKYKVQCEADDAKEQESNPDYASSLHYYIEPTMLDPIIH